MKVKTKKILRITLISLASIFLLLGILIFSLRLGFMQDFLKNRIISYIENKIKTPVTLERVFVGFPNTVELKNLHLKGQKEDTLLFAHQLNADLDMWQLFHSKADITNIDIKGINANVVKDEKGGFNFDYILNAFATDKKEEEEKSKPFVLSLDRIKLSDIRVKYKDLQAKNSLSLYFKKFGTRVKKFDVEQNQYALGNIILDGLKFKLKQDLIEELTKKIAHTQKQKKSEGKPFGIALNQIKLTDFDIHYIDENAQTSAKIIFDELSGKVNEIDLQKQRFDVQFVHFFGANIDAKVNLPTEKTNDPKQEKSNENTPFLKLGRLKLANIKAKYRNTSASSVSEGMDFQNLDFSKLNTEVEHFKMENGAILGNIRSAEIEEKQGLNIQKLHTDFVYNDKKISFKNLLLQTPQTLLREEITMNFASLEQLKNNLGAAEVSANIPNAKIGFRDILLFSPALKNTMPFSKFPNAILHLNTRIKGKINDLNIYDFQLAGLPDTKISLSGRIKNATIPNTLFYDLKIRDFSTTSALIHNFLPKNTLPNNISLPKKISLSGIAVGTTKNINTHLNLHSSDGNAKILAQINMEQKNREKYNAEVDLREVNIGKIIGNKDLGIVDGNFSAKGIGFDPKKIIIQAKGNLNSLEYNGYRYKKMLFHATGKNSAYEINFLSKDKNADLQLTASGVYSEKNPTVKINGKIEKLDLHQLHFQKEPMALSGEIKSDFSNLNPNELNGFLHLKNFVISDKTGAIPIQSLEIEAQSTKDLNQLFVKSPVIDLEMTGKYHLTQIFASLEKTLNEYYTFQKPSKGQKINDGQHLTLKANLKNNALVQKFFPELKSFETIKIEGKYQSDNGNLSMKIDFPHINFAGNIVENGNLNIYNENNALQYTLNVEKINTEQIAFNQAKLTGKIAENTVEYRLSTKDEKEKEQFLLAGEIKQENNTMKLSLYPDGLKINYENWLVDSDNLLQIGKKGILAKNFILTNNESLIALQSETETPNSPLDISINNFKIENITEIIKKDSLLAKGNINGKIQIKDFQKNLKYNADILIENLQILGNKIGNLSAKAENKDKQTITTNISIEGIENQANITGEINTQNQNISMTANVQKLSMKSIQGFTMNAIENAEGHITGNINISGKTSEPNILGNIKFHNVGMKISQTGSQFKNINDQILFQNQGIALNNFKLNDTQGNSLIIDGKILTKNYKDFDFNLTAQAKNFKVVDTEENPEKIIFGTLTIDTELNITGNLDLPKINGNINITDDTNFTLVLPQNSPTLKERDGIVEFIDQNNITLQNHTENNPIPNQTNIKGMDVSVNIALNPQAKIAILIDKANGDLLQMQGKAQLSGGIDPSGKTTLIGTYQVQNGTYEMAISMLKRKFQIEKESTITWTGEPTTAKLNLTAIYQTKTAPIDLLQQQLPSAQINYYKQKIPFNTKLLLTGELMKPIVKFDITADEEVNSVSQEVLDNINTKLQQLRNDESELAKQVFALLTLNRFIGENPLQSQSGVSTNTMLKQSVSQVLSQQINNLAEDLINGVELSFDLDSYEEYSSGNKNSRTDLSVNLSKKLLNDKLKISVGSNFGVEGNPRKNEKMNNIAGNINIDYLISKNGNYKLKAYRKNDYQVALQGQIIETGLGFVITLDYNEFKEIIAKRKLNKKQP